MKHTDILLCKACDLEVFLTHQCKTENGVEPDETFTILEVGEGFETVTVINQYNQKFILNPNQLEEHVYNRKE